LSVGTDHLLKNSKIKIYPNPSNSQIKIENLNNAFTKISIWNINGQLVFEKNIEESDSSLELDIKDIANGLYFLHFSNGQKLIVEKIVIQK